MKPCPFCGSLRLKVVTVEYSDAWTSWVVCLNCEAQGPKRKGERRWPCGGFDKADNTQNLLTQAPEAWDTREAT